MSNANKMPRPIQISRKLKLSSEDLVVLAGDRSIENPHKCTFRNTGCPGPIHTC
jgi:hypothetical protein